MNNKLLQYSILTLLIITSLIFLLIPAITSKKEITAPNDWFFRQRAYPYSQINHEAYIVASKVAKHQATESDRYLLSWNFEGPTNIEGRITDIEVQPQTESIFAGTASGGVFKRESGTNTWQPIFDNETSLSIGDIAISESDPNIIYVGTGEANAGGGSLAYDGTGIYGSTDGGATWENLGLENSGSIGRMVVHPNNHNIVYVAAMGRLFSNGSQGGVYKTIDGGQTWEQKLFISDSTGAIDIVIDPQNPNTVYAAMWERVRRPHRRSYGGPTSGIYKSTDGGEIWTELTNGLPSNQDRKGRIGIDISQSDPQILYAIYADKVGYLEGVYRSDNGGQTWGYVGNTLNSNAFSSFGWWFGRIKIDPTDNDIVYVIGLDLYKTPDGGINWYSTSGGVHVDQHVVAFSHDNSDTVYLGNDGGFYYSGDGGDSWSWDANFPITQFYTCEVDEQHPERIYGGTQDNGTIRTMTGSTDDWERIYYGDGFRVLVNPINNLLVYAEYQYGGLGRSTNGGNSFASATNGISSTDRFNWNCPLVFDPTNPSILYFGTNKLYRSDNDAVSWTAISEDLTNGDEGGNIAYNTLTTISVSPVNNNIIYTGSDDGNMWRTTDGGDTWARISDELPNRWVNSVATHPTDENILYVTFSGYRWDEYLPHVFYSEDKGGTWIDISSNLPEAPVNEIIIDPYNDGYLYTATDFGVYYSENNGDFWSPLGTELPTIVVNDLRLHNPTRTLIAATYGRGIYKFDLSLLTGYDSDLNINSNELICYPIPASNYLNIKIGSQFNDMNVKIEILDIFGNSIANVYEGKTYHHTNTYTWNTHSTKGNRCTSGTYIVQLTTNKGKVTEKFILQ